MKRFIQIVVLTLLCVVVFYLGITYEQHVIDTTTYAFQEGTYTSGFHSLSIDSNHHYVYIHQDDNGELIEKGEYTTNDKLIVFQSGYLKNYIGFLDKTSIILVGEDTNTYETYQYSTNSIIDA